MGKPKQERCLYGHRFSFENTAVSISADGTMRRYCKTCKINWCRSRYRNDPAYREYHKQKSKRRYAQLREQNARH